MERGSGIWNVEEKAGTQEVSESNEKASISSEWGHLSKLLVKSGGTPHVTHTQQGAPSIFQSVVSNSVLFRVDRLNSWP